MDHATCAPLHDLTEDDLARPGIVFQVGIPPGRIDILTELTGVSFGDAWPDRDAGRFGGLTVDFLGREAFIRNKRATGRTRDLAGIEGLSHFTRMRVPWNREFGAWSPRGLLDWPPVAQLRSPGVNLYGIADEYLSGDRRVATQPIE